MQNTVKFNIRYKLAFKFTLKYSSFGFLISSAINCIQRITRGVARIFKGVVAKVKGHFSVVR